MEISNYLSFFKKETFTNLILWKFRVYFKLCISLWKDSYTFFVVTPLSSRIHPWDSKVIIVNNVLIGFLTWFDRVLSYSLIKIQALKNI